MKIIFVFSSGEVNGRTIVQALNHVTQFMDTSLLETATVHPVSVVEAGSSMSNCYYVATTDDVGQTFTEWFYRDGDGDWLPVEQHPLVKGGVLKVKDEEE